jgi:hypothetical protein
MTSSKADAEVYIRQLPRKFMKHPLRTAAILALVFTYGALWIAFVTTGEGRLKSEGGSQWVISLVITLVLIGMLFLAGWIIASSERGGAGQKPLELSTVIAVLLTVGALLGLVPYLRAVLWGGPAWLRWVIVGTAIAALVIGSGRAVVWTVLAGLIGIGLGMWRGHDRGLSERLDTILTDLMVGATVGAVLGTLWGWGTGQKKHEAE